MVFNLFCIEKLKHEEIAKMLGIGTSTSRTRLLRARHLIQKELYNRSIAKSGRPYGNPRNTPKGLRKVFSHECTNFN
jgi:predicted DNA-binding protein (UPF0251 family)